VATVVSANLGAVAVGILCWGLGVCVFFPVSVSVAAMLTSTDAAAPMTAVGYSASILAPSAIGLLSGTVGLSRALLLLAVLCTGVMILARHLDLSADQN